ncbi:MULTISPECIES: DUF3119 family protein [unclassified Coleofasciculus]|uniref:DUF3119 family protein n=1 Tax=unclassified Coleofasciculus TaxID=2692782 RepID=UPI001880F3D2|nr:MULTISPECIES: DUF3119 family protein [unclassified Coleofasciculus]MBE9124698.1 DUF3119 family protein [Coleofasciculus sp. LEGE 07081]MBE9147025.1 DUF3119 family protein [Coleofasciculus sp. LEGE 07092]
MTSAASSSTSTQIVELSPSYTLPLALLLIALPILLIQIWVSLAIALFGLFLMVQAATIRLKFTETALDVYRSQSLIRRFPYQDWQNWHIYWYSVPILFYFKEVNSIHFLPILFDPKQLKISLEQYCPRL